MRRQRNPTPLSMATQTILGFTNTALLGFPKWLLDREGQGIFQESEHRAERISRGLGTFLGFSVFPKAVFAKGGAMGAAAATKVGLAAKTGKGAKLATTAMKGAGGFAAYETLRAPDESFLEKARSIPMAATMGASLGVTGALLAPVVQKHGKNLYNALMNSKDKDLISNAMQKFSADTAKVIKISDEKFINLLKSKKFAESEKFIDHLYTGTRQKIARAGQKIAETEWIKNHPKYSKFLTSNNWEDQIAANTAAIVRDKSTFLGFYEGLKKTGQLLRTNKLYSSGRVYGERQGKTGQKITKLLDLQRDTSEKLSGGQTVRFTRKILGFTSEERNKLMNAIEGRIVPDQKIQGALEEWRKVSSEIAGMAQKMKLPVKDQQMIREFIPKDNYFPHFVLKPGAEKKQVMETLTAAINRGDLPKDINQAQSLLDGWFDIYNKKKSEKVNRLISWYADKNKTTFSQAKKLLTEFGERESKSVFGNLEYSRVTKLPFWDPDPLRVLPRYIASANARLIEAKTWGADGRLYQEAVKRVKQEGGDFQFFEELKRRLDGASDQRAAFGGLISPEANRAIRTFQAVTKLGPLSTVANLSQSTNTAMLTGIQTTSKNISKWLKSAKSRQELMDWAERTGATLHNTLNDYYTQTGISGSLSQKYLKTVGFLPVDKFNRTIAANSGRDHALNLAKQLLQKPSDSYARRGLKQLGIKPTDVLKNRGVTLDDQIKAAQKIVNRTQFRSGPLDVPIWFTSPEGRIVAQFKNFSYNQAKLIKDVLKEEALKGNMMPIARAVVIMPILGEGVRNIRALLSGDLRDKKGLDRLLDNVSSVGAAGMFNDMYRAAQYNALAGHMAGPTVSDLATTTTNVMRMGKGDFRSLQRQMLRNVPAVGPLLQNTITPSRALQKRRKKRGR